jgi:hypothetical protein
MMLALEKLLTPATSRPETPGAEEREPALNISVLFTSTEATIAALRQAGALASRLLGRITLVVPQVVPYPLPLESPPVLLEFSERRFRTIAEESPVETMVHIYLCRDSLETLLTVLQPHSLVVVGSRKRWWPTSEKRLAKKLRGAGHEVVLAEME